MSVCAVCRSVCRSVCVCRACRGVCVLRGGGAAHSDRLCPPTPVAPSKPVCSVEGQTVIGNNVQLSCRSQEGSPEPQYSWRSYSVQHQERPLVPPGKSRGRGAWRARERGHGVPPWKAQALMALGTPACPRASQQSPWAPSPAPTRVVPGSATRGRRRSGPNSVPFSWGWATLAQLWERAPGPLAVLRYRMGTTRILALCTLSWPANICSHWISGSWDLF